MPTADYKIDGQRVSGVTTIIGSNLGWSKGALMFWAWNEGKEGRNYRETSDAAASAGISPRIVPHQLRHAYATEMVRAGVSLTALMTLWLFGPSTNNMPSEMFDLPEPLGPVMAV